MKLRKPGQSLLAAVATLGLGLGITSCGRSNTVDYVYVTNSKNNPGQINVYRANSLSGALTQIADSPYSSQGRNPVAATTSPDEKNLFVVNRDDNTIVQFAIGTDAKLYPRVTCNTPGAAPNAIAVNQAGTLLFVTDVYQPTGPNQTPYSPNNPGPGAVVVFPLDGNQSLSKSCTPIAQGALGYVPINGNPVALNSLANDGFLYVAQTAAVNGGGATVGQILGFSVASNGVLTAVPGGPFPAGITPSSMASDPTSRFLYVTDSTQNQLIGYVVLSTGVISPFPNGPTTTGNYPLGVVVDPRGLYIYVSNYNSNNVMGYAINQATGVPSALSGTSSFGTGTGPTCLIVEPSLARYIYTANFIDNSVTGLRLDPNNGGLTGNQNSPYPAAGQPTCVTAVPHGNHKIQHVQATAGS